MNPRQLPTAPKTGDETPWFDGAIKPARVGLYQRCFSTVGRNWYWSYWTGKYWLALKYDKRRAGRSHAGVSCYQSLSWRGLASPAK